MGVIGDGTHLAPTFTIGTGFAGRSSVGENVGPEHLINWKRIAFPINETVPRAAPGLPVADQEIDARVREAVRNILALALDTRGTA